MARVNVNEIRNKITAKDQTGTAFKSAGANATKYGSRASRAAANVKRSFTAANAVMLAATGIFARMAFEAARDAATYQQSLAALDSQVQKLGLNGKQAMEELRESSAGLLDDKSLVEAANQALSLGIGYEKLGGFMDIARAKARDMGTTTEEAFKDLTKALGRSSALVLDNLGIIVKTGEANKIYAESIGKTVSQLTEQEKKLAFQEAALKAGTEALSRHNLETLTQAERIQAATAQLKNVRLELGLLVIRIKVGVLGVFQQLAAGTLVIVAGLEKVFLAGKMTFEMLAAFGLTFLAALFKVGEGMGWLTDKLGITENAAAGWRMEIDAANEAAAELQLQASATGDALLGESVAFNAAGELAVKAVDNFKLAAAEAAVIAGAAGSTRAGVAQDPRVEQEKQTQAELLKARQDAIAISLQTEQAFDANLEAIHQDQMSRKQQEIALEKASAAARTQAISGFLGNLAAAASASNASFESQKKIAIAQALVATYQATANAAKATGNYFVDAVLAVTAFAAGMARVNAIRKTKPGASGGAASPSSPTISSPNSGIAPAAPISQQNLQPQFNLTLQIEGAFDPDKIAATLIPSLNKFGARGTFPNVQIQGAQ